MIRFKLSPGDTLDQFLAGWRELEPFDVVSHHANRWRRSIVIGRALAWCEIDRLDRPLIVEWLGRIDIPRAYEDLPLADEIEAVIAMRSGHFEARVLRDIRTEAREHEGCDVAKLVDEDIERGDLPNRLIFRLGVRGQLLGEIGDLRRRVGADRGFDWRRVRVHLETV